MKRWEKEINWFSICLDHWFYHKRLIFFDRFSNWISIFCFYQEKKNWKEKKKDEEEKQEEKKKKNQISMRRFDRIGCLS